MTRPASLAAVALALPVLLAACGGGAPAPAPTPSPAADGYRAKVAALAPKLRAGVLLRAVRDAGRPCQQVTAQQAVPGKGPTDAPGAAWLATCDDGGRWVVAIADDGTATVTDAHDLAGRR